MDYPRHIHCNEYINVTTPVLYSRTSRVPDELWSLTGTEHKCGSRVRLVSCGEWGMAAVNTKSLSIQQSIIIREQSHFVR